MSQIIRALYFPRWVCATAIAVSSVALLVQAAIDIDQGTAGIPLFSRQWFTQAWQMGLVTLFIIMLVAFAGRYLRAGARWRAAALNVCVVAAMWVTVTNGADFMADNRLAITAEETANAAITKDIAEFKNKLILEERNEFTNNAWRTVYAAKTPAEKEKILRQIQALAKDGPPTLVTPEVHVVRSGSGSIWNRWLGWRPESIQEAKAVVVPVLIMLFKTIGLTIGFAYWPAPGQLPEPAPRAQSKAYVNHVSRFTYHDARTDIIKLASEPSRRRS